MVVVNHIYVGLTNEQHGRYHPIIVVFIQVQRKTRLGQNHQGRGVCRMLAPRKDIRVAVLLHGEVDNLQIQFHDEFSPLLKRHGIADSRGEPLWEADKLQFLQKRVERMPASPVVRPLRKLPSGVAVA